MTERVNFDEVHLQDIAQATAGSTGTKTATTGKPANVMKALLIEIASVAGGGAATSLVMPHNPLAAMIGR
jgi:hypothetical protein